MTTFVFHGDSNKDSRNLLQVAIQKEKGEGRELLYLDGEKISPRDLETALATANLFAEESLVIEGLLSRLKSHDKDACLELLAGYTGRKHLLLWEKKALTKLALGKLGKDVKVSESKAPTALFAFCESLYPGNLKHSLLLLSDIQNTTPDILIFTMLARQVSYLIMLKSGTSPKFAPWQLGKLRSQADKWSEPALIAFLERLLAVDLAIKTGQTKLSYLEHLDSLLVSLLG